MHIVLITAGGAGMFCGSCMHDNTWARALMAQGHEVSLVPTYTPIRVDDADQSLPRVFFGGINVYLNERFSWWRKLPRPLTAWLDRPGLIQWATRSAVSNNARELGEMTVSMLRGMDGPHARAVRELADFVSQLRPDAIIFSNALLAGALPPMRQACDVPILCTLQGDDVFLDALSPADRERCVDLISQRAADFDGMIVNSEFYRDHMAPYLRLPPERFLILPLGIDLTEHTGLPRSDKNAVYTVGFFARFSPEKGFHHFVDALLVLPSEVGPMRVRVGGYASSQGRTYLQEGLNRLQNAGIDVEHVGSPPTAEVKAAFLSSLDVLSVPTEFLEPKGIYVLEALANGVPVVQPAHGAFPEILTKTGGGLLVPPRNPKSLAAALAEMSRTERRMPLAERGWAGVREHYDSADMASRTSAIIDEVQQIRRNR